jgi:hypothetical protein
MEKKLLIAVDDSRHSENALRYAASLNETVSDSNLSCFTFSPRSLSTCWMKPEPNPGPMPN